MESHQHLFTGWGTRPKLPAATPPAPADGAAMAPSTSSALAPLAQPSNQVTAPPKAADLAAAAAAKSPAKVSGNASPTTLAAIVKSATDCQVLPPVVQLGHNQALRINPEIIHAKLSMCRYSLVGRVVLAHGEISFHK